MRAMVALLALIVGGWWRLPLTGASGGAAAVCRAAASAAAAGTRFHRSYGLAGSNETIRTVLPTSDGGFLLVGQVGKVDQTSSLYPFFTLTSSRWTLRGTCSGAGHMETETNGPVAPWPPRMGGSG